MAETMSQEITKVMDEQSALEAEYAELVQQRDQLKGISNKQKLLETKEGIMVSTVTFLTYTLKLNMKLTCNLACLESGERAQGLNDKPLQATSEKARRGRQSERSETPQEGS